MAPQIVFIGPRRAGKTSLFAQLFPDEDFDALDVAPTVDTTVRRYQVQARCRVASVDVVDAPNIRHNQLLNEAAGIVLVLDAGDLKPLETQLKRLRLARIPALVVLNKRDLNRDLESASDLASTTGQVWDPAWSFAQTCGLDGADGVFSAAFDDFALRVLGGLRSPRARQDASPESWPRSPRELSG